MTDSTSMTDSLTTNITSSDAQVVQAATDKPKRMKAPIVPRSANPRKRAAPVRFGDMVNTDNMTDDDIDQMIESEARERDTRRAKRAKRPPAGANPNQNPLVATQLISDEPDTSSASSNTNTINTIPIDELKVGDILFEPNYLRVHKVLPFDPQYGGKRRFDVTKLRSTTNKDENWTITTMKDYEADSASRVVKTVDLPKTKLAEKLTSAGSSVFSVTYRKVLDEDELKRNLNALKQSTNLAQDVDRIIDSITTDRETTTVGRLIKSENMLGYSLVDDLTKVQPSGQTHDPVFRNVNHRDILKLTLQGVCYQRKR
jgi:hypothetical protein